MATDIGIVFGKNWLKPGELSPSSKLTALAAAKLYQMTLVRGLIWTGGQTAGKDFPAESEAMLDFARHRGYALPKEHMKLEKESLTTRENIKGIIDMVLQEVYLDSITTGYHSERATRMLRKPFGRQRVEITAYKSEDVLEVYGNPFEQKLLIEYHNSDWVKKDMLREKIINPLDKIGLAFALDWVSRVTRSR